MAAVAVAGCGSSSKSSSSSSTSSTPAAPATTSTTPKSSSGGGGGGNLKLSADPSGALKFDKSSLSSKAGSVTITMSNPSSVPHGVAIQGSGINKVGSTVNQGGTSTVTAKLKPGKYTFYCPVPGHRQAGMQGTLTVQ
ncbi:MAG: plastocyanin/azurin family copper-binding protein [Thermoleophilaceae bacterium]